MAPQNIDMNNSVLIITKQLTSSLEPVDFNYKSPHCLTNSVQSAARDLEVG